MYSNTFDELYISSMHSPQKTLWILSQVKVTILSKKLRVVVKGQVLVDGQLERAVLPDDSTWAIETLETGAKRLTVTLSKVDDVNGYNFWPCVIKGHPQVDPYERPIEMTKNPLLDG